MPPLLRRWLPSALLVLGVLVQVLLVVVFDHSSWGAGAGFGMYSRLDAHPARAVRAWVSMDGTTWHRAVLPDAADRESLEWRVLPTDGRAEALARVLATQRWTRENGVFVAGLSGEGPAAVRVKLFTVDVDRASRTATLVEKASFERLVGEAP